MPEPTEAVQAMSRSPNFLLIVTDQQRADHCGFGGNPVVQTPNMDALAARGTVFDRAYVANPICMPNRCSILTGRMPSSHGVIFNDRSLDWKSNTFVRRLADAGYRTGLVGKAHIQHGTSRDSFRPLTHTPAVTDPHPAGWNTLEDAERYEQDAVEIDDFYGFEHVEFALGHGDMVCGHHRHWAIEKGGDPDTFLDVLPHSEFPARQRSPEWWQIYQPELDPALYSSTFVTERSLAFLDEVSASDAPFCLQVSYPDPHHPFTPPGDWWNAYRAKDMPLPDTFSDPLDRAPAHLRLIRRLVPRPGGPWVQMFGAWQAQVEQSLAAEYGMISMIDEGIGRILAALEASGAARDTIVIFTSDHGDMFGDHGLMLKATMHYQGCIRVPLVVARPGRSPARTASLASSMDLAQTILELAGVEPFSEMQGVSLVAILDDPASAVRDHILVEEDFPLARQSGGRLPLHSRTLVTDRYRTSRYSTGDVEVFDLEDDASELDDLAESHPELRGALSERLADALMTASDLARME